MFMSIKKLAAKYWVEVATFCLLMLRFVCYMPSPDELSAYVLMPFLVSYKFGLGSRFLIGSIIQLFVDFITVKIVWIVTTFATILLLGIISLFVGKAIRSVEGNVRNALLAILAVYIASPLATYLLEPTTFGRMELFHEMLILMVLLCVTRLSSACLIPVLSVICVAIHQVYVFLYFAPLLLILLYNAAVRKSRRYYYVAVCMTTAITTMLAFSVFQFGKSLNVSDKSEMLDQIAMYSDISLDESLVLDLEYFTNMQTQFQIFFLNNEWRGIKVYTLNLILLIVFFSPFIVFFTCFWRKCIDSAGSRFDKWVFRLALLSPFSAIPAFVLTIDYGRWICAILFMQFVMLFYFISHKYKAANHAINDIYNFVVPKYRTAFFVLLLYFVSLGQIGDNRILRSIYIIQGIMHEVGRKVLEIL